MRSDPHPGFSPLSSALSPNFKATGVSGGTYVIQNSRLVSTGETEVKKGPYLEPFYHLVERKTHTWKILENKCKK